MPPFYPRDNLDCWFAAYFTERYEALEGEDKEAQEWYEAVTNDCKDMAEEALKECGISCVTLIDAILHSVDWDWVVDVFEKSVEADPKKIKIDSADGSSVGNK